MGHDIARVPYVMFTIGSRGSRPSSSLYLECNVRRFDSVTGQDGRTYSNFLKSMRNIFKAARGLWGILGLKRGSQTHTLKRSRQLTHLAVAIVGFSQWLAAETATHWESLSWLCSRVLAAGEP